MTKTFRTLLFATALVPVAAFAQDATTTTPGQNQDQQKVLQPNANAAGTAQGGQEDVNQNSSTGNAAQATDPAAKPTTGTAQTTTDPNQTNTGTAQTTTTTTTTDTASAATGGETFVTVPPTGAWRVADLTGKDVYGADGKDIGEINDVIVGQDGRVIAVIVGVGGFLGIGEKNVAVSMTALQFGPGMTEAEAKAKAEAAGAAANTAQTDMSANNNVPNTAANNAAEQTGAVATDTNANGVPDKVTTENKGAEVAKDVQIGSDALPDKIVLNVTKQQLEDAPAFEGIRGPRNDNNNGQTQQ